MSLADRKDRRARDEDDPRPYRLGVGVMLLNRNGEVFVGQRIDAIEPAWQMPQGGIDKGETPLEAAWRELVEETGTDKAELLAESPGWLTYDLPAPLRDKVWKGRYRGQKQKWFAMRFTGCDEDINIVTDHPEFSEWRWAPYERLAELIIPFKRPLYVQVIETFRPVVEKIRA